MKLMGIKFRVDKRKDYFTEGVIKMLDLLSEDVVMATGIDSLKSGLQKRSINGSQSWGLGKPQYSEALTL